MTFSGIAGRVGHHIRAAVRFLDPVRRVDAFSSRSGEGSIGRIYVINLDRKPLRWRRTRSELHRFKGRDGEALDDLARRFSAIDARYMADTESSSLIPTFTLAEQLAVSPIPLLIIDADMRARRIEMTRPEIAVALSHIEVWRHIAAGDVGYVLVLEDDVMMRPGFARRLDREWRALVGCDFDLLYLAYHDVGVVPIERLRVPARRTKPGLWEASAYILSRTGAQKLLELLPAHGPIDLWLNLVFNDLRVFTTTRPIMEQRLAEPSTNSYSVLPVLSQVGVVTRERPLVPAARRLPNPVVVVGSAKSGSSSLGLALSMLGYRTVSDVDFLPIREQERLERRRDDRVFGAYVNIASVELESLADDPKARFIATDMRDLTALPSDRTLRLTTDVVDKWGALTDFLGLEYPSFPFPEDECPERRRLLIRPDETVLARFRDLRWDRSPWIVPRSADKWNGIPTRPTRNVPDGQVSWAGGEPLNNAQWHCRSDTFPSNLALFRPSQVAVGEVISLTLDAHRTTVRDYVAGAIAGRRARVYGSYAAELRPARGSGVITGLFLHRNGPRQEIDIEFRGRDTTKMLVNVFYNPGPVGTALEYGYRGTPAEIDLGFDAADDFHRYEIVWQPERITWKVDGRVVYARWAWNPTPIPDRPLEFNINIWTSRSAEFAGALSAKALPCATAIRRVDIR